MSAKQQNESPEDIKAQIAAVKAATQERALSRKEGLALSKSLLTPIVPIEGEETEISFDADKRLEAVRLEAEAEMARKAALDDADYLYFVKCRKSHPKGTPSHGIYLTKNPGSSSVKMNEWWSRYKKTPTTMCFDQEIVCQVCLWQYDQRVPLDVVRAQDGSFTVANRWLWRRPKDNARAVVEGETRANEGAYQTSNQGRADAMQRAREAGFEVAQ